ncbi:MAG: hypothetical protein IJ800_01850, partial [Clostridia bacterium]|nr:hypothetical protein [Clostridia bacterium]
TVDNVYVSCSRSGPAAYDAAIAFSISSTTRVSNTVVEMKYSNVRTDQAGHAVIVSAAYDSGSVFNNVYGISDFEVMGNSSAAPTAIGSHSDYVGTEGNGVKTYKYTDEMTFDGLTSSVWNTQGIIPVFAKDNTTFADYKIEHYYKKDGRYVLYKTENKTRGAVGGVAYASTINIAGYGCFVGESGTVDKTTIKADGSSVLKLYYRPIIGIPLTNKDGSDTNSTLSVYGSTYASIEYQGDFNGKTDVYRVDYADIDDTWYSRLEFVGITAEEFLKTGCDMLDFNLYVDGKNPVYLNVYNGVNEDGTGATSKSVWITNSISAQNAGKYITILDPTGKSVDKITFGAWYRIRCYVGDLSGAFPTRTVNLSSQKANKLYVSGLTLNNADDQYGYTLEYYFKDGDGEYVKNADLTEEGSAFYGAQISPKAIDGYLFGSFAKDKGDGEKLTIDEDGLTISLYYDRVYRVSSNAGAYLIPYGNRDIKTDKPDDDGFYKITVGEYSANHWAGKFLYTAGVNDLTNKYSSVTFKIRFTEYALTNEGHWVIYSGINGKAFAYSNIEGDVKKGQREGNLVFYDEDGNAVTKLIADETYTVWVNLLNASDSYTVSIGASGVNVVYYMTDLTFAEKVNYSVEIYKKSYISDEYQKDDELSFAGVAEKGESVTVKAEEIAHYTLNEELSGLSFTAVEGYVAKLYYDEEATYVYTVNYVLFIGDGTRTVLTTESGRGYEGEKVVAEIKYFAKYYYLDASVVEITVSAEGENVINVYYETEEARKVKDLTGEDIFD